MRSSLRFLGPVVSAAILSIGVAQAASASTLLNGDMPSPAAVDAYVNQWSVSPGEAQRRLALQERLRDIGNIVPGLLGDSYGGLYFDNTTGRFEVRTTDVGSRPVEAVEAYLRDRDATGEVSIREAAFPLSTLTRARDQVIQRLASAGLAEETTVGIDIESGAVGVDVTSPAYAQVSQVLPGMTTVDDDSLSTAIPVKVHDTGRSDLRADLKWCAGTNCTKPLHAAVGINLSSGHQCSLAGHAALNNVTYVITAGHCGAIGETAVAQHPERPNADAIGPIVSWSYGQYGDIALIRVNSWSFWYPGGSWPNPLLGAWPQAIQDYTIDNASSPVQGVFVWWGGRNSWNGGTFSNRIDTSEQFTDPYTGVVTTVGSVSQVVLAGGCPLEGSSGGAVWINHTIYGVMNAGNCTELWLTNIYRASWNWGVFIAI